MSCYADYMAGVEACKQGDPCPENASEPYQRGYGLQYAIEQSEPPLSEKDVRTLFDEMFRREQNKTTESFKVWR